jgi:hypothetical protein
VGGGGGGEGGATLEDLQQYLVSRL